MIIFLPLFGEERSWYILSGNSHTTKVVLSKSCIWIVKTKKEAVPQWQAQKYGDRIVPQIIAMPIICSFSLYFSQSCAWKAVPQNLSQ